MKLYTIKSEELLGSECELLSEAMVRWTDLDGFSDEQVARVKAIFARVFGLASSVQLVGSTFPDAIMLQEAGNNGVFYGLIKSDDEWEAFKLDCCEGEAMSWAPGVRVKQVLALLADSDDIGMTVIKQE